MSGGHGVAGFAPALVMWTVMTGAMMAPVVWPWLRALRRALPAGAPRATVPVFVLGYGLAWSGFSVAMASAQVVLAAAGATVPVSASVPSLVGLGLVTAGAFQFSRLKHACLDHCRSPLAYFATRWRPGLRGALRMGVHHGVFCLGCCWALMALALIVGAMDVRLMIVMTAVMILETATPMGAALSRPLGGVLVICGVVFLVLG